MAATQKKKDDQSTTTKEKKPLGRLSYKLDYEFDKNIVSSTPHSSDHGYKQD
jgi:hypothetical protein